MSQRTASIVGCREPFIIFIMKISNYERHVRDRKIKGKKKRNRNGS